MLSINAHVKHVININNNFMSEKSYPIKYEFKYFSYVNGLLICAC